VYATGEPVVGREARALLARGPGGSIEEAFFDYIYAPVRDPLGNVEGVFVHGFEVTELVRARQRFEATAADNARLYVEAQRASRELDQQRRTFLSTAAHDLRTPIAAIRATAQLARRQVRRDGGAEKTDRLLGTIELSTQKMAALIDELLDITQSESASGLVLSRTAVDLHEMTRRVVDEYRSFTTNHALRLVENTGGVIGHWDARRLERVIDNLISNAIKYSPDGGDIVVNVTRENLDGHVLATVSVRDSGLGIRPDELDRVFHRFERGSNVADIPGNGIGLAYAKDIAAQHGGTISVTSELGQGSTFTLRLPLTTV
jgi:signal transduction histidine kinase